MQPNFEPRSTPPQQPQPVQPTTPPPVPSPLRQDHSMSFGEQHTVDVNNLPKNAGNNLFQPTNPTPVSTNPDYDFILNPAQPNHSKIKGSLPHGSLGKIIIGSVGVVVVIILIAIIGSLFKSSSDLSYFVSVLQDQQELIHISNAAVSASDITSGNQTFVSTASVSLRSNSIQLQSYLAGQGDKVGASTLSLKISKATDTELNNAETSGNFNTTFDQVATAQLNNYISDLRLAYSKATGPHGRALLSSFFNQAKLLLVSVSNGS